VLNPATLSISVKALADDLRKKDVSAFTIVNAVLATHAYGGRQAGKVKVEAPPDAEEKPVMTWLEEVSQLYELRTGQFLDGRRAVVGLALLEARLGEALAKDGMLAAIEQELAERGGLQLSSDGARRRRSLEKRPDPPSGTDTPKAAGAGTVPTLEDAPAELDELGRATLAEVVCRRIRRVRLQGQTRAFSVHIDGRWGSGKSSLMNLLARELRARDEPKENRWIVITFNAWAHQRIDQPWWWLMTKVHRAGKRDVWAISRSRAAKLWLLDAWWRLRDGWAAYLLAPVAAVVLILLWRRGVFGESLNHASEAAKAFVGLIAFGALLWGGIKGARRWLHSGPGGAATSLLEQGRDPLEVVRRRFTRLAHELRPLAIFIDDLDRCRNEYVVRLLEGIQTLFADVPVVYVIAADGAWLRDAYMQAYGGFSSTAGEPGRPLGALFLEKTFQQTVPLPGIPADVRARYWQRLLNERRGQGIATTGDHRQQAEHLFEPLGSEPEILGTLSKAEQEGTINPHELRRAAALQLGTKAVEVATRHALDDFAPLLEDNPRAMKKLVNMYGLQRDLQVIEGRNLAGDESELRQLALWTIIGIRWPLLSAYLVQHPDEVKVIWGKRPAKEPAPDDLTPELERLLRDPAVLAVVTGQGIEPEVGLDAAVIKRLLWSDAVADADGNGAGPPSRRARGSRRGSGARARARSPGEGGR
jgi:KAP family P-loop domain